MPNSGVYSANRSRGPLGRAVLAQQAHVEVPVVGGALGLAMARGRRPGARQVVEAVPVDPRHAARQQLGRAHAAPKSCTSSAPKVETPTSETQTGSRVTASISASLSGHSSSSQWFQSSGKPCTATASIGSRAPCPCMFWMNKGSIGEMPPSTREQVRVLGRQGLAGEPRHLANAVHSGSASKSQCDLLLGSFQIIAASIIAASPLPGRRPGNPPAAAAGGRGRPPPRDGLRPRSRRCGASLRRRRGSASTSWSGRCAVALLDEMQARKAWPLEHVELGERVVRRQRLDLRAAALHRLEHQEIARDVLVDQIERQQRVPQMVEHAHEQHDVEAFAECCRRRRPKARGTRSRRRRHRGEPRLLEVVADRGRSPTTRSAPRRFISIA